MKVEAWELRGKSLAIMQIQKAAMPGRDGEMLEKGCAVRDVVSVSVSLVWGKKKLRRAIQANGTAVRETKFERVERRLWTDPFVQGCEFSLVLLLARLPVSGVCILTKPR